MHALTACLLGVHGAPGPLLLTALYNCPVADLSLDVLLVSMNDGCKPRPGFGSDSGGEGQGGQGWGTPGGLIFMVTHTAGGRDRNSAYASRIMTESPCEFAKP